MMVSVATDQRYKDLVTMLAMEEGVTAGTLWRKAMDKTYGKKLQAIEARFFVDSGTKMYQNGQE